jgi:hypothetical protein
MMKDFLKSSENIPYNSQNKSNTNMFSLSPSKCSSFSEDCGSIQEQLKTPKGINENLILTKTSSNIQNFNSQLMPNINTKILSPLKLTSRYN